MTNSPRRHRLLLKNQPALHQTSSQVITPRKNNKSSIGKSLKILVLILTTVGSTPPPTRSAQGWDQVILALPHATLRTISSLHYSEFCTKRVTGFTIRDYRPISMAYPLEMLYHWVSTNHNLAFGKTMWAAHAHSGPNGCHAHRKFSPTSHIWTWIRSSLPSPEQKNPTSASRPMNQPTIFTSYSGLGWKEGCSIKRSKLPTFQPPGTSSFKSSSA